MNPFRPNLVPSAAQQPACETSSRAGEREAAPGERGLPRPPLGQEGGPEARVNAVGDEENLIGEAILGRRWAQREIWFRFAPMVYGLLRRTLGSQHDHDDLMQEVFLRVFRRLSSLEKPQALRSFVYSVAFRVVSEEIRHFGVIQRARARWLDIPRPREHPAPDHEWRDILERVGRIMDSLPPKHRAVFVLRHVEGLDLCQISANLAISLATVKRHLVKATRQIDAAVAHDGDLAGHLVAVTNRRRRPSFTDP
jgi:RNA polymerase sigma-70 factor (ECF subfamily)